MTFVVDTNVIVVANGRDVDQVTPECVLTSVERLTEISRTERIATQMAKFWMSISTRQTAPVNPAPGTPSRGGFSTISGT
jgi:hypothetical protein